MVQGIFENVLCEKSINIDDRAQSDEPEADSDVDSENSCSNNEVVQNNFQVEIITENSVPQGECVKFSYYCKKIDPGESASESDSRRSSSEKNLSETVSSNDNPDNDINQDLLQDMLSNALGGSMESLSASIENLSEEESNIFNDIFQDILAGAISLEDAQSFGRNEKVGSDN